MLIVRQLNQPATDQWTMLEIKRGFRLQCGKARKFPVCIAVSTQIVLDKMETALPGCGNPLHRRSFDKPERRTQCLVTRHDPVKRTAKRRPVQNTLQTQTKRNVIGLAYSLHLCQKPQPLLRKRYRQCFATLDTFDSRKLRHGGAFQRT